MRKQSLKFLEKLVNTPSPCSRELAGQKVWKDYIKEYADTVESDSYGNVVAKLNPGAKFKVVLAAHADEIAMTVSYINEGGYIYIRRIGGINPIIMPAQRVVVHTQNGPVYGVIGCVAPHLSKGDAKASKTPAISDLFIDIGAANKKEALELVKVGDMITVDENFKQLNSDIAVARAFDNRTGTFSVAEAFRLLSAKKDKLKVEVCAVSNIMEEVGCLGIRQIGYELNPDVAIITDVTHATDYPTVSKEAHGDIKLGEGPSLTFGGGNHAKVLDSLETVAKKNKIPYQREASSNTSGTDLDALFWTRGGIPCGLISLPNRYMHSPVEMIHLKDLEYICEWMAEFALSLHSRSKFKIDI